MTPSGDRSPLVHIVLLNYGGWRDTLECLDSLEGLDYPNYRTVVVDNASPDGSEAELRRARPDLSMIQSGANLGFAGGNNLGIRHALERGAHYVWLLNNDTVVEAASLTKLVETAEAEPSVGMVGSKLLFYDAPDRLQAAGGGRLLAPLGLTTEFGRDARDDGSWDKPLALDHLSGASMLVRREAIEAVGLMDESYFMYREETDWCLRMRFAGWELRYAWGSRVWHKEGRSAGYKSARQDYYVARNMLFLMKRFYPHYLPSALLVSVGRSLLVSRLLRLRFGKARAVMRAYLDFLTGRRGKAPHHDAL